MRKCTYENQLFGGVCQVVLFCFRSIQTVGETSTDSQFVIKQEKIDDEELAKRLGNSVGQNLKSLDSNLRDCLVRDISSSDKISVDSAGSNLNMGVWSVGQGPSKGSKTLERTTSSERKGNSHGKSPSTSISKKTVLPQRKKTSCEKYSASSKNLASGFTHKSGSSVSVKEEVAENLSISETLSELAPLAFSKEDTRAKRKTVENVSPDMAFAVASQTAVSSDSDSSAKSGFSSKQAPLSGRSMISEQTEVSISSDSDSAKSDLTSRQTPSLNESKSSGRKEAMISSDSDSPKSRPTSRNASYTGESRSSGQTNMDWSGDSDDEPLGNWVKKRMGATKKESPTNLASKYVRFSDVVVCLSLM